MAKAKYSRVYPKHGAWFWVEPRTGRWIRLCSLTDPESKLLERFAQERKRFERPDGTGDMRPLIDEYVKSHKAQHKEKAWPKYGEYAGNGFRNANVADVKPTHVNNWLKVKYAGKLHMQRVMRAFLSGFFQWCVDTGKRDTNPCREVKLKKPKDRTVYIPDDHFVRIRASMMSYTYTRGDGKTITAKVPTGPMMQCCVDLCYLALQRSTEIRNLRWERDLADPDCCWVDWEKGVLHFLPSKTEDSSGVAVDISISPEIRDVLLRAKSLRKKKSQYVIHAVDGKPYEATAIRSAWDRACVRAGLPDVPYTVKDIRAKAATDAHKLGYDLKEIMEGLAHTDEKTTEIYLKQRIVPRADVRLALPPVVADSPD